MEEFFHGGLALLASGHDEEGTEALRRYTQLRGGRWPNNFIIRHLVRVGRTGEAESLVRAALTSDEPLTPSWGGHYISLVEILAAQGRIAAATAVLEEEHRIASTLGAPKPLRLPGGSPVGSLRGCQHPSSPSSGDGKP